MICTPDRRFSRLMEMAQADADGISALRGGGRDVRLSRRAPHALDRGYQIGSRRQPAFVDGDNLRTQQATTRSVARPTEQRRTSTFIAFIVPVSSETQAAFAKQRLRALRPPV